MACAGCVRAGCFCDFCAPSAAPYLPKTPFNWTLNPAGFSDDSGIPYSLFNGLFNLVYGPTAGNNCVWSVVDSQYEIVMAGGEDEGDFRLAFRLRQSGCMITYSTPSFDCSGANSFRNPSFSCGVVPAPANIDVVPSALLTDCCFRAPMAELPQTLFATVQNVSNAACVDGVYQLDLDQTSATRLRYLHWNGDADTAIELDCGAGLARYWNLTAVINGCHLTRTANCDGTAANEDDDSSYDPFILRFMNLVAYQRFPNSPCCANSETSCANVVSTANVIVTT